MNERHAAIGIRIAHTRMEMQLTRYEMACRLGVSPGAISAAERGDDASPLPVILGLLLHFPGVDANWLLAGRGGMVGAAPDTSPPDSGDLQTTAAVAERLFSEELAHREGQHADRLSADKVQCIAVLCATYMSHLWFWRGCGRSNTEAHALALEECEQLIERETAFARECAQLIKDYATNGAAISGATDSVREGTT